MKALATGSLADSGAMGEDAASGQGDALRRARRTRAGRAAQGRPGAAWRAAALAGSSQSVLSCENAGPVRLL